ncbi:WecB/TagA/CpsF family glycosyltransferase [Microbispora sp. NPDC046933]|uniref:WecB/TagA/CpsF family glycosyltransferase n=1 Tax=Microbispora sp. NPDC046933 TaxID=3155618 RepID=UPI00341198E5
MLAGGARAGGVRVGGVLLDPLTEVFVGLGFPRQDRLIAELRADLPGAWFVGAARPSRSPPDRCAAPGWMGDRGLEWLFRLISEPQRLARRYLVDDLPFALRLLSGALLHRALGTRNKG